MNELKNEKVSPVKLLEDFLKEKNIELGAFPQFVKRDDGTFSIVLQFDVKFKK